MIDIDQRMSPAASQFVRPRQATLRLCQERYMRLTRNDLSLLQRPVYELRLLRHRDEALLCVATNCEQEHAYLHTKLFPFEACAGSAWTPRQWLLGLGIFATNDPCWNVVVDQFLEHVQAALVRPDMLEHA